MTNLNRIFYSVGIVGITILLSGDECDCNEIKLSKAVVTCIDGHPVLTDGDTQIDEQDSSKNFNPADYKCPNTSGSPIWQGSTAKAPFPLRGSAPSTVPGKIRAATGGTVAYVPVDTLDLPFSPRVPAIALSACDATFPDILQVNHDNNVLARVATCPFALKKSIRVASRPLQVAVTPDGLMALVTSFDNAINFVDLTTNTVAFTLSVGFYPHGLAITSDGKTAWVSSFDDVNPLIAVVDIASRAVTKTYAVAAYPQSVFLSPDDAQLYITFPFTNAMYIMDTMTGIINNTYAIPTPRAVAFNSRGSKAFISSATGGSTGQVLQFDIETFKVEKTYTVGAGPTDLNVLQDDLTVVVVNYEGGSTSTINLRSGQVTTTALKGPAIGLAVLR